jgi:hypothetical protein
VTTFAPRFTITNAVTAGLTAIGAPATASG